MTRTRLIPLAGLLCLSAGCTSFADRDTTDPAGSSPSSSAPGTTTSAPSTGLAVTDETDLAVDADTVTGARVLLGPDGSPVSLVLTSTGATVVGAGATTSVTGTVVGDLVVTDDGPVAVTLTADPVSPDPVLGLFPVDVGQVPNGSGPAAQPVPLQPGRTAPRGVPLAAATSADGGTLYLLVEDTDAVGATVLALDPGTGEVLDTAEVDPGVTDPTALELAGLTVTGDGDLVVGLTVDAAEGTASVLVGLDGDLAPSGDPLDVQPGEDRAPLVAVTTDADGAPVALLDDPAAGLTLVEPDLGTGEQQYRPVDAGPGTRAAGLAVGEAGSLVALLDQDSPTVVLSPPDDADPTTVELCTGTGDALAVTADPDGGFLVVGTCDGESLLWTLG